MQKEIYNPQEGEKFARQCDITGEGMNNGWYIDGGKRHPATKKIIEYVKYEKDAIYMAQAMGYATLKDAYDDPECETEPLYWTEWEMPSEAEYIFKKGKLSKI